MGGGKRPFFGYDLGGASACDQVAMYVEVVPGGGAPRPEARPSGLLAGAARKGRLLEGGSGQEAHFWLALGAVASARGGEAFCVEPCNPFVLVRQEKTLKRLRLRRRNEITPEVAACDARAALRPTPDRVERVVCLSLEHLDGVEKRVVLKKPAVSKSQICIHGYSS